MRSGPGVRTRGSTVAANTIDLVASIEPPQTATIARFMTFWALT
jgi:hypothetical protein